MISLLESAKLADGRNILNFSVDTVDELALLPSGGAKWESMGHDYGVPAVGSTATLEDTGETYYLNKYLQWELVGKGEVLSSVYYVAVEEAQDGNYYSNYTFTEIKNYYEEGNGIYLKNGEDIYILSYINNLSAQFVQIYNHNGVRTQSFMFSLVDGELIITKHDLSFGLLHVPTSADYTYGQTTVTYDTTDGITIHGKTKFVNTVGEDTFDSSIEIPIQGKDGITIDKDSDTEFVNIRGAKAVILDALPTAKNGMITEAQLAELQASTSNYIMFNNKKYTYVDNTAVMAITELKLLKINGTDQLLTGVTFDDTVTTI